MSNLMKAFILFLIFILASIIIFFLFFFNIFKIDKLDFINSFQENKIKKELNSISEAIDTHLEKNYKTTISKYIETLDNKKFINKDASRGSYISKELSNAKNLIISDPNLKAVKLFDNNKKIIFSTLDADKKGEGAYLSFKSSDNIEDRKDFYDFSSNKIGYILDSKTNSLVYKVNLKYSDKTIAVLLFYYDNIFLVDLLKKLNFTGIKRIVYTDNNIIILNKPDFVKEEYLNSLTIQEKLFHYIYRDEFGNEIEETFRVFGNYLNKNNLIACFLINNDDLKLQKTQIIIVFYLAVFTLYLLILSFFLLSEKSKYERAKGKASLFTAALLEEIINAKNKNELASLQRHLSIKKENAFKILINDTKKLDEKEIKNIKDQLDLVFDKINETLEDKLKDYTGSGNLDKVEALLEKFVNTIAQKGIQINAPVNVSAVQKGKEIRVEEVESLEEVESVEDIEEAESVDDIEEAEEISEAEVIEEAEAVEEIDEAESEEEIEEAESVEDIEEAESVEEAETGNEIEEAEFAENIEETESMEEVEEIETFDNGAAEEIEEAEIVEDFDEDEGIKEEEIIDKTEDLEGLEEEVLIEDAGAEINDFEIEEEFKETEDIEIEDLTEEFNDEDMTDNIDFDESDIEVEVIEENDKKDKSDIEDVPKIPKEYYENNMKDDLLAKQIQEISEKRTPLQELLYDIYDNMNVDKLSLLISAKDQHSFLQIDQIGSSEIMLKKIVLDINNPLVKHIYDTQRMVFVANPDRLKDICDNDDFENAYSDMKSLFIYPVKYFGKIRSLILLFFKNDRSEDLENIIDSFDKFKSKLKKNINKVI